MINIFYHQKVASRHYLAYICSTCPSGPRDRRETEARGTRVIRIKTIINLKDHLMTYKIEEIEGVGAVYAEKLIAAGVKTVEQLLDLCAKPAGRKALAEQTEISPKLILKWTNHADLF